MVKRTPCVETLKSRSERRSAKARLVPRPCAQGDVGDRKGDIPPTGIVAKALRRVTLRVTHVRTMGGVRSTRPRQSMGDTMPGPSSAADRRPDSSTCPRAGRGTPTPFKRAHEEPLQSARGTSSRDECAQTSPDIRVVLVTEGGLELPLVASSAQVAQLLESVSEMAAGLDPDGLLLSLGRANRRAHPVRMDQVLSRVRVVVQRGTSTKGDAS